ncbi:hypothetical protein HDG38_000990 [Paraburkholderia sp. WSM4177]|nr:hypothetical protein [Paraburkholderia sp. WSM4177]MBB5482798.1 hypothetical protein [Paraburkholderia sp. WSM4180]
MTDNETIGLLALKHTHSGVKARERYATDDPDQKPGVHIR